MNELQSKMHGSSLQQEQCDLRCFLFSSLHHFLSVFYPQGCSRLSPKASWLNVYLLGKLWLVCACVCQREWVCFGANECVSSCGPVHHGERFNRAWGEDEKEGQECTPSHKDEKNKKLANMSNTTSVCNLNLYKQNQVTSAKCKIYLLNTSKYICRPEIRWDIYI